MSCVRQGEIAQRGWGYQIVYFARQHVDALYLPSSFLMIRIARGELFPRLLKETHMPTDTAIEQRLAAVENAVADLKSRLGNGFPNANWLA